MIERTKFSYADDARKDRAPVSYTGESRFESYRQLLDEM